MAAFTDLLDEIEIVGREYRALTQAERSLQNQLRALLRSLHAAAAEAGATSPAALVSWLEKFHPAAATLRHASFLKEAGMLNRAAATDREVLDTQDTDVRPAAPTLSHAGDQVIPVTQTVHVPAWLRKPPKGLTAAQWHPEFCLPLLAPAQALYTQSLALRPSYAPVEQALSRAVERLPIWIDWCAAIRGISAGGLGLLLAETGDLWWYPTVAKVWKRCGVGLHEGERQRRKLGMAEQEARAMAYNPRRRSVLYMTQIGLRNQNKTADGTPGVYRQLYLDRKQMEAQKAPQLPKAAWDARAMRYMVKRFLRDLWVAWRQTMPRPAEIPVMPEAVAWAERAVLAAAD